MGSNIQNYFCFFFLLLSLSPLDTTLLFNLILYTYFSTMFPTWCVNFDINDSKREELNVLCSTKSDIIMKRKERRMRYDYEYF
jgi:hypothetical protein